MFLTSDFPSPPYYKGGNKKGRSGLKETTKSLLFFIVYFFRCDNGIMSIFFKQKLFILFF